MNKKEWVLLLICLLIGFALRVYTFDRKSLWIDEIHTYNDSRDDLKGQLKYFKENPTNLHPPLFYVLTHLFYPFPKPERDLRIIPLIFGILSILMIYFLSKSFSSGIALPCTICLTFMTYHIYFSQDGRMYSLLLFMGMAGLYFFMKHLLTSKNIYLALTAVCFAILFHTNYSSILFIAAVQILWFYRIQDGQKRFSISSCMILNGFTLLLCIPWILFLLYNFRGQPLMDPLNIQGIGSLTDLLRAVLNDWAPYTPLAIVSGALLVLFPVFSKNRKNALILLAMILLPILGLYYYCKYFKVTQFITSRYFINFLPVFLIALCLSLEAMGCKFIKLKRLPYLFLVLFVFSNAIMLPLYYTAEKQNFRGLVNYLNQELRDGDSVFVGTFTYIPGLLYYFKVNPVNRHYEIPYTWKVPGKVFEFKVTLVSNNNRFSIYHSNVPFDQYVADGSRLWILVGKESAKEIKAKYPCVLKGYFDGSFSNFRRFPSDASMYLFLWNPRSPDEKGIEMPME